MNGSRDCKLRICGAVTLLIWVLAIIACAGGPLVSHHADAEAAQAVQHGHSKDGHETEHHGNSSAPCHENPFCEALNATTPPAAVVNLSHPDLISPVADIDFHLCSLCAELPTSQLRQRKHLILAFRPAVCLGADIYGNGPPALA